MPISVQRDEPSVFYITPIVGIQIFALVFVTPALLAMAFVIFRLPFTSFGTDPELWWLPIMFVAYGFFAVRLIFPPRRALSRVQARPDGIRLIPSRGQRYITGVQPAEAAITPQSREILLAHCIFERWLEGDRLVVRGTDQPEQEVKLLGVVLSARDCRTLSEGITTAVGLPVRLVIRRRSMDGTVQESPWLPAERKGFSAKTLAMVATGAAPFIGGGVVGYLLPSLTVIVATGLILWFGPILAICVYTRKRPTLASLSTVFTFGAAYGVAVVFFGYMLRSR
jgi:hypothetical protein